LTTTDNARKEPTPARITVQRRVEWSDTDAAGHQHFTAVLRWAEQAEILLHERLGIADLTVGHCPRVHVTVDFSRRLRPRQVVDVDLGVTRVGRSSIAYDFSVRLDGNVAARGKVVAALVAAGAGAASWPHDVRRALLEAGAVDGERYASMRA
jgi:acyl-CoA thioesterase FadM